MIEYVKRLAGPFTAEGQTDLPFGFKIFEPTDVFVATSTDPNTSSSMLVYGKDYSVNMNPDQEAVPGGKVVLSDPVAKGQVVVVGSAVAYTQNMQLTNFSRFPPEIINESLDRIVVQIQQLVELTGRTISLPPTSNLTVSEFLDNLFNAAKSAAKSAEEAKKFAQICEEIKQNIFIYSWDIPHVVETINDVENYPYDGYFWVGGHGDPGQHGHDISNRFVKANGSTELRTLGERFSDVVNVKDFGAKGDGVTDDTKAFEDAVAKSNGKLLVFVPEGSYNLTKRIKGIFFSYGKVITTLKLNIIDLSSWKTNRFVDKIDLGIIFTAKIPKSSSGLRMHLQGFCTDGEDKVFIGMRSGDESVQIIRRYSFSTGDVFDKEFSNLSHINDMTYCDGKLYVAPMSSGNARSVVVIDATTLIEERSIALSFPAYAIAYDSLTDRFYVGGGGSHYAYTRDFVQEREIPIVFPSWAPRTGQGLGAYNGLLFFPRSGKSDISIQEAVLIFDSESGELVHKYHCGQSIGELESVDFFKGSMLLGANAGAYEFPFYIADFDLNADSKYPITTDTTFAEHSHYFQSDTIALDTKTIFVDASAKTAGVGSEESPFNSLSHALWCAANTKKPCRTYIHMTGDFTDAPMTVVQGFTRLLCFYQWSGKPEAILPPLRIYDVSSMRLGDIRIRGTWTEGNDTTCLNVDDSTVDIRGTKFDVSAESTQPDMIINSLRGDIHYDNADFSSVKNFPKKALVLNHYGTLLMKKSIARTVFPTSYAGIRFQSYGPAFTQYADCRKSIMMMVYTGGKNSSAFDSNGDNTVFVPEPTPQVMGE